MRILIAAVSLWCVQAWAQPMAWPTSASTKQYFAQLADGGPSTGQKWTTTIIVVNPSTDKAAVATLSFRKDDGQALALDFGRGALAETTVNLAAGGTAVLTSTGSRETVEIGWATALSDIPVLCNVMYRAVENGKPVWDVAAPGTGSTYYYTSYGNRDLGVALGNPDGAKQARLLVTARDLNGRAAGTSTVTLAPYGHTAFNVGGTIAGLPPNFSGSVTVTSATDPPQSFVAWSVSARDGLLAPLPAGEMVAPAPPERRPADTLAMVRIGMGKVMESMRTMMVGHTPEEISGYLAAVTLQIEAGQTMAAAYSATDKKIRVSRALLEALGDSEAAMAFLFGHYLLHATLAHTGMPSATIGIPDTETAADTTGIAAALKAGYDPAGIADFYGRVRYAMLQGVPADATLANELQLTAIETRMTKAWQFMQVGCTLNAELAVNCQGAHKLWHPSYPALVP